MKTKKKKKPAAPKKKTRRIIRVRKKPETPWMPFALFFVLLLGFFWVSNRAPISPLETPHTQIVAKKSISSGPLSAHFNLLHGKTTSAKVEYWSEQLATSPAVLADLMAIPNAPQIEDSAPFIPSRFDCTTFVETVSALARSESASEFYPKLLSIRYHDSHYDFASRNHFPEADWIPHNAKAGILKDATVSLAEQLGITAQYESKTIERAKWFAARFRKQTNRAIAQIGAQEDWKATESISLPYLPLEQVIPALARIPSGTIINLVRKDAPHHPVLISHQGFVIQKNGKTYLRHSTPQGHMATVNLKNYLAVLQERNASANWTTLGINLNTLTGNR